MGDTPYLDVGDDQLSGMSDWKAVLRVVHHELNNSLTPVLSLARSAPRLLGQPGTEQKLERIFDVIAQRAEALRTFLAEFAELARVPAPSLQPTHWSALFARLAQLFDFRYAVEPPELVSAADPRQIEQVLINLLKNAVEAGSSAEALTIRVRRREDGAVEILVRDGGSGIPARTLSQTGVLFSSTKPGGSGVGLALSRALVEGHGGQMQLRNHPAGGLEVSIRLPDPSCLPS
jgi:nitrogen fixation/metabolism regulation signal transduction histidine kinase